MRYIGVLCELLMRIGYIIYRCSELQTVDHDYIK